MRFRAASVAAVRALLCLAGLAAQAQIRTETRVVLVDTIVTDKKGGSVRDLTAKDFRVWEDNKEQAIKSVSMEKGTAVSRPHYLVLFFAPMEASDRIAARQALSGFVDANAEDNRMMAVVADNDGLRIGQNFTEDAGRLKAAVNRTLSSEGSSGAADAAALDTVRVLEGLARNLGALPGRKTIVFVSDGLVQSSIQRSELSAAIDACNKSDVAVYAIDVRPISTRVASRSISTASEGSNVPEMVDMRDRSLRGRRADNDADSQDAGTTPNQQLLFRLANGTGGFVIANSSELPRGLQRIGEEQNEYYVLSYTPSESKEGTCHTLRVKVDRGGTTVRARTGYCESKPQDLLAGTITGQDLERRAADSSASGIGASMRLSYFYISPGVARVNLAMEIPADALKFETEKGKLHAEINFLGIASAPDGAVGARFSDALAIDPESKGKALHYEKEFRIAPGRYSFTIAFSSGGENFGKLEVPLIVDARKPGELAMSGIVLSGETHPAAELGLALAGLVENLTPLVTDDVQIVPSGSSQFTKSEPAYFYFEVYAPDPASVRVRVRVLDRRTGTSRWESGLMKLIVSKPSGNDAIPAGSRLPIEGLPAGLYKLEVSAGDLAGKEVRRTADFEVK